MLKTKIAVFVSGGGTNFEALINAQENGKIPHGEIVLMVSSSRTAYALKRAENHGIKSVVCSKKELGSQEKFEEEILKNLEENDIQLIVLAGFMSILSNEFTKKYENRIINIHASLIPSFCGEGFYGLHVHEAALKKGVKVTGATVHIVNEIPDGGPIIMQKAVYIEENDTPEILQKRVMEQAEWKILPESVELMCSGKVKIENGRTYCNE